MEARNREIKNWFAKIRTRQLVLPRFQRFEAWGYREIADLLTSVIRDLPVGSAERPIRLAAAISRACRPRFLPLDILVKTPAEVQRRLEAGDFFIKRILEKGQVLYER